MKHSTRKITHLALSAALVVLSVPARADLASDLTAYVDSVGGATTSTSPSVYEAQSRGYINGGRLYMRVPSRTIKPFSFKAPKISAGCGGIDLYGGSMSFISASELSNTLKQIAASPAVLSYALMLGIRTVSSQIANTMEEVFGWLQKANQLSINSCEAAANIVGAGLSFINDNQLDVNVCIIQTMESSGVDYNKAKDMCGVGGDASTIGDDADAQKLTFTQGNLVWQIFSDMDMFPGDNNMKLIAMSITGTITKQPRDATTGKKEKQYHPPLVLTTPSLLETILYGSPPDTNTTIRYNCTDNLTNYDGCVVITEKEWSLAKSNSLVGKTKSTLVALADAIADKSEPPTGAVDYVASTAVPTMRIVRTAALMPGGMREQIINDYAERIAIELLYTYISSIAHTISAYSFDDSLGKEAEQLREGIKLALRKINDIRKSAVIRSDTTMQIAEQLQYYERIIISAMPEQLSRAYAWSTTGGR